MATEYLIPETHTWNQVASFDLSAGNIVIKLTTNINFGTTISDANARITMADNVTFDGQGYIITLQGASHSGLFNLPDTLSPNCNIQNLGFDANNINLVNYSGYIVYGNLSLGINASISNGNLYNCYVKNSGTVWAAGGLVGGVAGNSNINIYRCTFRGVLDDYSGGIMGITNENFVGEINIKECYSLVTSLNFRSAGILALVYKSTNAGTINIFNCYSEITTGSSSGAGIYAGHTNSPTTTINIRSCYSVGEKLIYTPDASYTESLNILNCRSEPPFVVSDGSTNTFNSSTSTIENSTTDLSDIQGQVLSEWTNNEYTESNTWTTGTDTNYPTLDQFTLGPWINYTVYNEDADLTPNYKGGNARGSSGGGGGDPHIFPLFGKTYDLPNWNDTFLLLDNKKRDKSDRLIIKGKCWYVPRQIYEKDVDFHIKDGISKLEYMDFYRRRILTFFKYLKIGYNNEEYIFDMDSLKIKRYTNHEDFDRGRLPTVKRYKKSDSVIISKIMKRYQLLFSKPVVRKAGFNYSKNAMAREITIHTKNNKIDLVLISDPQIIDLRNSIELTIQSNAKSFYGSLIRKEVKTVEF